MASSDQPARSRFHLEVWSWSTWLVLCVVSYPVVALVAIAPRAGLVNGMIAVGFLLFVSRLGYAGRSARGRSARLGESASGTTFGGKEIGGWLGLTVFALGAAGVVGSLALLGDRSSGRITAFSSVLAAVEVIFIWRLLPWLAHDAQRRGTAATPSLRLLTPKTRGPLEVRAALALTFFLALVIFGLGASWSRGGQQVPSPTPWLVAFAVLALALMFVERVSFLERSARVGNLLMPTRCYPKWVTAGLLVVVLAAALAAAAPWKPPPEGSMTNAGSDAVEGPAGAAPALARLLETAGSILGGLRESVTAVLRAQPALLVLWLLLALLAAAALVWAFRRSRAVRWLARATAGVLSLLAGAWRKLLHLLRRLFRARESQRAAKLRPSGQGLTDPLFDVFEHPEVLAALSPREVVIRTYHLLLNFAEMLGHGRHTGQTPFEYAQFLRQTTPKAGESLTSLTWAYAGAMYGGGRAELPKPSAVQETWQRISQALTADMPAEDLALRRRAYFAARMLEGAD